MTNDSVSRAEVIKSIGNNININFEGQRGLQKYEEDVKLILQCLLDEQIKRVKALPSVAPTQKVGKWIDYWGDKTEPDGETWWSGCKCSECNGYFTRHFKYCPNCGSRNEVE